ncbi:E3 ubiquitin-protein ligase rnf168 [Diabrotica virgifera virgifera]|uniref:RING-type E3 ubiquitin transferase n=1 Tax=Diabrotica virgifera virgifera TaxID=50390 RepID=A0A6P7FKE8_DIAVI|nr:E3 ubiquitin-protein ligase rnf168 [Diabrotica virgifera virgifera]
MTSKRSTRNSKTTKTKNYDTLILNDVLCPICRSILVEPVTLPCNHVFCLFCFENTMENANLVCPLCRLRIGSWLRKVKKENNLINADLWKAIKDKFPQHVKNKSNGVDENLEEERHDVIVAYPGEIRKEYEIQKQKEDDELRKQREADLKASEELIRKLKEEEDYQKAVMEEKLKFDEEIAKKLAENLASQEASTSKAKVASKKLGPMDSFVKKDTELNQSNSNNFFNKEYTCRILRLENQNESTSKNTKNFSPKIQKKIQQIQKLVDLDMLSDASDCIESELRYFKPIEYKLNPPSHKKTPLKITPKKLNMDTEAKVLSPSGAINFNSNSLESAFARFSVQLPNPPSSTETSSTPLPNKSPILKRTISHDDVDASTSGKKPKLEESVSKVRNSTHTKTGTPKVQLNLFPSARKKLFNIQDSPNNVESPPFCGFEKEKNKKSNLQKRNLFPQKRNGMLTDEQSLAERLKREQEKSDLEYAKRLQEALDEGRCMRSSRSSGISKRQSTLDEMIKSPYRIKSNTS